MIRYLSLLLVATALPIAVALATPAYAQDQGNHAPVCQDKTIVLSGVSGDQPLDSFEIDSIMAGPAVATPTVIFCNWFQYRRLARSPTMAMSRLTIL